MSMPAETIISSHESDPETLAESGFYWRERDGVKVLVSSALEAAGFVNGFSTRLGGVSPFPENSLNLAGFDEDTAENIAENRRRFLAALGSASELATAWQVHGNSIKAVRDIASARRTEERYDGLISDLVGVLVGVKTADCVPVLIGDPVTQTFAAVHAGWRGSAASIVIRAVDHMRAEFGSDPANMIAAIGPAASGENYEVGTDVIDAFAVAFTGSEKYFRPTRPGHAKIDLHLANKDQLISTGVSASRIFIAPFCTIGRSDLFFSYRLEKKELGKTGRLLSVIGRESGS